MRYAPNGRSQHQLRRSSKLENFIETMQYLPWAGTLSILVSLIEFPTNRMDVPLYRMGYIGFSALRAYALSRNRPLSVLVFVLSIVPIAVNLVSTPYPLVMCLCERNSHHL